MEYTFKTELHCHSKDASDCSSESVEGICEKYIRYGYTTVCLTNHFTAADTDADPETWAAKIEHQYAAWEKLKACAAGRLSVLLGMEFRFRRNINDYLVFGFDRTWLLSHTGSILQGSVGDFTRLARPDGILTIHAHPFRTGMTVTDPADVDGIEVFNGHPGHNSRNDIAEVWAKAAGKIMTSGTDHHNPDHMPRGGIRTKEPITSESQLVGILKSGEYSLIRDDRDTEA